MGDYGCMLRAYRRHIIDAMLIAMSAARLSRFWRIPLPAGRLKSR
jgi:hypothetical protein